MRRRAAIIFDLDNTLLDRSRALRRACSDWLGDRFPRFAVEDRKQFVDEFMDRDEWGYTPREDLAVWMKTRLPSADESAHFWIKELRMRSLEHVHPDPTVVALIERLAGQTPLGVVSNGSSRLQRAKLVRCGIDKHFSTIVISQEHGRRKPDPRIFQTALDELGSGPNETVYVGDDPWRDIQGAARLGMSTCWVSHGRSYPAEATRPNRIVNNIRTFT